MNKKISQPAAWPHQVSCLIDSLAVARKALAREYRFRSALSQRSRDENAGRFTCRLRQGYYVTTEKGVFLLEDGRIRRVCSIPCYGLAFSGEQFFITAWFGHRSALLQGERAALEQRGLPFGFRTLYDFPVVGSNDRMHQAYCSATSLWVAHTGRNTLLEFDLATRTLKQELAPFCDRFDRPILYDNNHINSVAEYDGIVLFCAYGAGRGSLIGIIHDGQAHGFEYKHMGVHDIFLSDNNFFFCDTFASKSAGQAGCVVDRHGPIDESFFRSSPRPWFPRGIAGDDDELLVGCSFEGEKRERFRGRGNILVIRRRQVAEVIELPAAQVYQIATRHGAFIKAPATAVNAYEVLEMFRESLGPPVYTAEVPRLPRDYQPHRAFPGDLAKTMLSSGPMLLDSMSNAPAWLTLL